MLDRLEEHSLLLVLPRHVLLRGLEVMLLLSVLAFLQFWRCNLKEDLWREQNISGHPKSHTT